MRRKYIRYSPEVADRLCALTAEGHTLAGVAALPDMLGLASLFRWMRERPELAARCRKARARRAVVLKQRGPRGGGRRREAMPLYSRAIAEAICDRIGEGRTTRQIAAEPGMPPMGTLYLWLRREPEFAQMFGWACEMRGEALADEIMQIADHWHDEWRLTVAASPPGAAPTEREALARARLRIGVRIGRHAQLSPRRYRLER